MRKINVSTQKIKKYLLKTCDIVIAAFYVFDKLSCSQFFQKTFLLANIKIEVVFGMPFLIFSNLDIQFAKKELSWKIYNTKKALSTIY